jgi:hypothetical protein
MWPWQKDALWTVFLICSKLIQRPTARLTRIPPQMWEHIVEMVPVENLGRNPGTAASVDVAHSLEMWSVKHEVASLRADAAASKQERSRLQRGTAELQASNERLQHAMSGCRANNAVLERQIVALKRQLKEKEIENVQLLAAIGMEACNTMQLGCNTE